MDEYFCTNCGATLNDQPGFDPDEGVWVCTECGQSLYGDDFLDGGRFPGTIWRCDECGAILNTQYGFDDSEDEWECSECGHVNPLSEDEIYDSEADWEAHKRVEEVFDFLGGLYEAYRSGTDSEDDDEDEPEEEDDSNSEQDESYLDYDDEDEDEDDDEDDEDDTYAYGHSGGATSYRYAPEEEPEPRLSLTDRFRIFVRRLKIALTVALVVALGVGGFLAYRHISMSIPMGISSDWATGKDYQAVVDALEKQGFTNVEVVALEDLSYESINEKGQVDRVSLSRKDSFEEDTKYPSYSPIKVCYHSPRIVEIPISAKEAKGMDYKKVADLLKETGFGSIQTVKKTDLVFGVFNKPDTVESITIDGDKRFRKGESYPIDAEITIEYHAFKNK